MPYEHKEKSMILIPCSNCKGANIIWIGDKKIRYAYKQKGSYFEPEGEIDKKILEEAFAVA